MDARSRLRGPASGAVVQGAPRAAHVFAAEASVVLLRPRRLRGTIGVLKRHLAEGWEVEIRSPLGTPMHLTLPERALHLR